jgi:hypothetical protein
MTSAYILVATLLGMCALVAALVWISVKYGKITILKDQAIAALIIKQETENEMEKLKTLPISELDNRLSKWMHDNK